MEMFKGQISYDEFMNKMPKKHMISLYMQRYDRLVEETRSLEESQEAQRSKAIRDTILNPY